MRRIKMVLAVAAAMAIMLTASVAPALAHNNNNDRHLDRVDVRLDHRLLNQNNSCCFGGFHNDFDDGFLFSPFTSFGFHSSCPFWGDTEGIVNQWDCFH